MIVSLQSHVVPCVWMASAPLGFQGGNMSKISDDHSISHAKQPVLYSGSGDVSELPCKELYHAPHGAQLGDTRCSYHRAM